MKVVNPKVAKLPEIGFLFLQTGQSKRVTLTTILHETAANDTEQCMAPWSYEVLETTHSRTMASFTIAAQ